MIETPEEPAVAAVGPFIRAGGSAIAAAILATITLAFVSTGLLIAIFAGPVAGSNDPRWAALAPGIALVIALFATVLAVRSTQSTIVWIGALAHGAMIASLVSVAVNGSAVGLILAAGAPHEHVIHVTPVPTFSVRPPVVPIPTVSISLPPVPTFPTP